MSNETFSTVFPLFGLHQAQRIVGSGFFALRGLNIV
jgi:hypothetical protein